MSERYSNNLGSRTKKLSSQEIIKQLCLPYYVGKDETDRTLTDLRILLESVYQLKPESALAVHNEIQRDIQNDPTPKATMN